MTHVPDIEGLAPLASGLAVWASVLATVIPAPVRSQQNVILGRVVEHETGNALPGVTVSIRNTPFRTVTDDSGRFSFIQMESGTYHLTFQLLGYAERSEAVELSPDASAEIEVRLSIAPMNLAPIAVTVRSGSIAAWLASRGFAKRGLEGTAMLHVDYDELRMTHHRNLNDVLRNVPGVRIRELADQDAELLLEPDPRTGTGSCRVSVYLNGSNVEFGWNSWVGNADVKRRTDWSAKLRPAVDEDLTGTVGGSVVDDRTGAVLPGVRVILEGTRLSAESDANGRFEIPGVLHGSYRVTAEYPGAARWQAEIRVVAYVNVELDLRLERGSTTLAHERGDLKGAVL